MRGGTQRGRGFLLARGMVRRRSAPEHNLEAAGLNLARVVGTLRLERLAARHALGVHRDAGRALRGGGNGACVSASDVGKEATRLGKCDDASGARGREDAGRARTGTARTSSRRVSRGVCLGVRRRRGVRARRGRILTRRAPEGRESCPAVLRKIPHPRVRSPGRFRGSSLVDRNPGLLFEKCFRLRSIGIFGGTTGQNPEIETSIPQR
jgi:hypothetical protein